MEFHDEASQPEQAYEGEAAALLNRLVARFKMTMPEALDVVDSVNEVFGGGRVAGEDAIRSLQTKHRLAWHFLIAYQTNQRTAREVKMATRAMALELGYSSAAGADSVAGLVRICGLKKQTINKAAMNFQIKLGLPPRPGQRDDPARRNMRDSRNNQLKKP